MSIGFFNYNKLSNYIYLPRYFMVDNNKTNNTIHMIYNATYTTIAVFWMMCPYYFKALRIRNKIQLEVV